MEYQIADAPLGATPPPSSPWLQTAIEADSTFLSDMTAGAGQKLFEIAPEMFRDGKFSEQSGAAALQYLSTTDIYDFAANPAVAEVVEDWVAKLERINKAQQEAGIIQNMVGWGANNPAEAAAMTVASIVLTPKGAGATRLAAAGSQFVRTGMTEAAIEAVLGAPRRWRTKKMTEAATDEEFDLFENTMIESLAAGGLGGLLDGAIAFARRPVPPESFVNIGGEQIPSAEWNAKPPAERENLLVEELKNNVGRAQGVFHARQGHAGKFAVRGGQGEV